MAYDPWGVPLGAAVNGVGYTGHVMDATTSLTYMQQRYYDPAIGRVPEHRSGGGRWQYRGGLQSHAYVRNDPLNMTDLDGLAGCKSGDKEFTTCTITIAYK